MSQLMEYKKNPRLDRDLTNEEIVAFVNERKDSPDLLTDFQNMLRARSYIFFQIETYSVKDLIEFIKENWKDVKGLPPEKLDYMLMSVTPINLLLIAHSINLGSSVENTKATNE